MPRLGFVYETRLQGATLMVCIGIRKIRIFNSFCYDFLVLDGDEPSVRTWSDARQATFPLAVIMEKYAFERIA